MRSISYPSRFQKFTCLWKFTKKRDHESFHALNTIILAGYYQQRVDVYLFPGCDFLRTEKRRERETDRKIGGGEKTKQKYERWIIKIPLSGENDALEHECCSSLHHRSRFAEIYDMAVGIAHKTNFKTVRSATYRERKRKRETKEWPWPKQPGIRER